MKNQILYFDDFSTDGTREELIRMGIRVISWDDAHLSQYNKFAGKHPEWSIGQRLSVRVSYILDTIVRETNTEYLLLSDGDVMFVNQYMLQHLDELAEIYDIVYERDNLHQVPQYQRESVDKINSRYERKVVVDETGYTYWRMRHAHVFLNVKKLKMLGITSDNLDEETAILTEGGIFDTFSDFTNRVLESGQLRILEESIFFNNVIHFGGQASDRKGLKVGYFKEPAPEGGFYVGGHLHRPNLGQPVEKEFVVVDFNKNFEELVEAEFQEIDHILHNGYNIREIFRNKDKYKIYFKKIAFTEEEIL